MKRRFITENRYLLIPVKTGAPVRTVSFYSEEKKIFEFEIPVAMTEGEYVWDFQAAVPTDGKKEITVEGDVPDRFLDAIVQADHRPAGGGRKPLIHFMPESGWLNDPCGLLYDQGVYHLYFQHNPFDVEWGNMTWGHAVSRDLLHWEQLDEALWPDEEGTVFTGSALTNAQGAYDLPRDAQLYVYTCAGGSSRWSAGKKFVQRLAWSSDGGRTLHREDGCILDHIAAENRDMKIYWHEEGQHYYAVLYLEGNEYAILNSRDLKNWEITQRLSLPEAWECPDLFELPAEDGGRKWVFWTADGYYFVGTFDGSHFEHDGIRREAYHTMLPYAAQTFNGTERVISVPWMRTDNAGTVRRGMMGMPRQLTLAVTEDGYTLRQRLTDEFERCKEKVLECSTAE